ncbi:MAG: ATP-binding protein [Lachnospiraceae bacterium]|nr:ATP-binding protein [Lachnospiraceae bacterium]MCM1231872.1 ATP-binding protein [Ruminococcus flavefaciens]
MKGTIIRIIENDYGQEYGFISASGEDYYFDNRYLSDGTMSDFYEDDDVDFEPGVNPHDKSQKVAKNVKLNLGKLKEQQVKSPQAIIAAESVTYSIPNQESSLSQKWYVPGRSEKLILRDFSDEEVLILDKLKDVFYHTNAGHFRTRDRGINYGYSLLGPTKQFVIRLGMEKVEFAMILCNSEEFQRRTLEETFLHLTHHVIPKVRISGHFYILATKYPNIAEQIEKPEIQGALPYSIIPFSYAELLQTPAVEMEGFLLARFKKFLFERDFFSYSEPINDRLFLFGGRDTFAKSIADRSFSGDHSGIFGLRKSGKTSVINMIKQELEQRKILYIAYRCIEFVRHNWYDAAYKIVSDVYLKLGKEAPSSHYTETNAVEMFSKDMTEILPIANRHIVLIFDEIEQISLDSTFDEKWQNPIAFHLFWSTIITFCEKNPGVLAMIIAGINPAISEMDILPTDAGRVPPRNPVYKKLSNESFLKPFVYEQTKRMVNDLGKYMGFKFDEDVCFELQKDFGGHPYFTRQMCKTIVEYIRKNRLKEDEENIFIITRPLYTAVKETGDYEVASLQWCKDILRELQVCYPGEYKLLLEIANKDTEAMQKVRRSTSVIPHLIGYGLVRFDNASKEMEISIDIVRNYLINEKEYKKPFAEMTPDEIDDEIQDGISQCEIPLRKLIKDVLFTQLPRTDAPDFIKLTPSFQRDNRNKSLDGYTVQQLLDPRLVTLHFYVLKDIICGYDSQFKQHFELFKNTLYPYTKAEIESYLGNLYVARNTADHHFEIHNEGTLQNFRASLSEIAKLLRALEYVE